HLVASADADIREHRLHPCLPTPVFDSLHARISVSTRSLLPIIRSKRGFETDPLTQGRLLRRRRRLPVKRWSRAGLRLAGYALPNSRAASFSRSRSQVWAGSHVYRALQHISRV